MPESGGLGRGGGGLLLGDAGGVGGFADECAWDVGWGGLGWVVGLLLEGEVGVVAGEYGVNGRGIGAW